MSRNQDLYGVEPNVQGGGGGDATSLQGVPISTTPPTDQQVLTYDNASGEIKWATSSGASQLIVTNLTLIGVIAIGSLVYISADDTARLADGTTPSKSNVFGVYLGSNSIGIAGVFPVAFDTGLTLIAGQLVYLSATAVGVATNVEPTASGTVSAQIGILQNTTGYGTGNPVSVLLQPQRIIINR